MNFSATWDFYASLNLKSMLEQLLFQYFLKHFEWYSDMYL